MFLTAMVGAGISSFATVSSLSSAMSNTTKAIDKMDNKLDKFDDRIRQTEIRQAEYKQAYIAAN